MIEVFIVSFITSTISDDHPADRGLAVGTHQQRGGGGGLQQLMPGVGGYGGVLRFPFGYTTLIGWAQLR